jgi:hypothetical protein
VCPASFRGLVELNATNAGAIGTVKACAAGRSGRARQFVTGSATPLKPLVGRLATPDELTFPVSTVSRNRQNYPHDDLAVSAARP